MSHRSLLHSATWVLLVAAACSGGGSGCGSSCGASGCLTAIPGGFPPAERQVDAVSVKVSPSGFDFIDTEASALVQQFLGSGSFNLPCTGPITVTNLLGLVDVNAMVCDLNHDGTCESDETCPITFSLGSLTITPQTASDGSVNVDVAVNAVVNSQQIPVDVDLETIPLGSCTGGHCIIGSCDSNNQCVLGTCGLSCDLQVQSSVMSPIPVSLNVNLKIDPQANQLLAFEVTNLSSLASQIPSSDLIFTGGGCGGGLSQFTCASVLGNSAIEPTLLSTVSGELTPTLTSAINGFRCQACDASNNNACPSGSTCDGSGKYCWFPCGSGNTCATGQTCDTSTHFCADSNGVDQCYPAPLGIEGEANVGSLLSSFGVPSTTALDVSLVAGGVTMPPNPPSTYASAQGDAGLQVGLLGGTQAPAVALCAPPATWTMPPAPTQMNFDTEVTMPGPGDLAGYDLGISLSDDFLNKSLFDAWQAGLLCENVSGDNISELSTGLFSNLLANLDALTHQNPDLPMMVALRPTTAPTIRVGRGTVVPDGGTGTADPLITLTMNQVHIDFYAFIEERSARLFTLAGDLSVQISLDFDPTNNTVTPLLEGISMPAASTTVLNNDMNVDSSANLQQLFPLLLKLITPELTNVLGAISIPTIEGIQLSVLGARGSILTPDGSGYEHLALWATLAIPTPSMHRSHLHTTAQIRDEYLPARARPIDQSTQPTVTLELGALGADDGMVEYSFRIDGGFWQTWSTDSRPTLDDPILRLTRTHQIDVRSRLVGEPGTVDETPARVAFSVKYGDH